MRLHDARRRLDLAKLVWALSGALLAFSVLPAMCGIPHILNVNVLTIAIRKSLLMLLDFKAASTLSMVVIAASLLTLWFYRLSVRAAKKFETINCSVPGTERGLTQ